MHVWREKLKLLYFFQNYYKDNSLLTITKVCSLFFQSITEMRKSLEIFSFSLHGKNTYFPLSKRKVRTINVYKNRVLVSKYIASPPFFPIIQPTFFLSLWLSLFLLLISDVQRIL
jgi:hypothetical protein